MEHEQALNRIVELAMKWQDPAHWKILFTLGEDTLRHREQASIHWQMSRDPAPFDAALFHDAAKMNQEAAEIFRNDVLFLRDELLEMQNLVRLHAPTLLEMTVTSADVSGAIDGSQIRDLKRLEGAVRAMVAKSPEQDWKNRRDALNETVEDQMLVLFKKDERTAMMTAPEIAGILKCSEQAVRKDTNKVWQMFKAEKEANQQRLKRRHTQNSTDDIDDE